MGIEPLGTIMSLNLMFHFEIIWILESSALVWGGPELQISQIFTFLKTIT